MTPAVREKLRNVTRSPATVVAGASLLAAITAFFANILIARTLGPGARGHVALALQISYFVAPILTLGADKTLLRSQGRDRPPALPCIIFITLAAGGLLALFAPKYMWLAAPVALSMAFHNINRADSLSGASMQRYARPFVAYQCFILISTAALYLAQVENWVLWIVPYFALLPFLIPRGLGRRGDPHPPQWRQRIRLLTSHFAQLVTLRSQRLLLPFIADPTSLGLFIVVATATEPIFWLAQALADHRAGQGAGAPRRELRAQVVQLGAETPIYIGIAAAGAVGLHFLLTPIFGDAYSAAQSIIYPLALSGVLLGLYRQSAGWMLATRSESQYLATETIVAAASLPLYYAFISTWGLLGAAWATVAAYLMGLVVTMIVYRATNPDERNVRVY